MRYIYNHQFYEIINANKAKESVLRLSGICHFLPDSEIFNGEKYLELAHTKKYINRIKEACEMRLKVGGNITTKDTYRLACMGVGAAVEASETNSFALVRPPGHHAPRDYIDENLGLGFCFFNDVAIAAIKSSQGGKKTLIFDFDLHYGNGIVDCIRGNENIYYLSTSQENIWPYPVKFQGKNYKNITFPIGTGDADYLGKILPIYKKIIEDFCPDQVCLYAGFDGYYKDYQYLYPDQGFKLTLKTYQAILDASPAGKTYCVLGGGYNPETIYDCVELFIKF